MMANLGLMDNKADFLSSYGVESTLELLEEELDELIYRLKQIGLARSEPTPMTRQWRSKILTVLTDMGIYNGAGSWQIVNTFLLDNRIAGKLLYELTVPEMKVLHRKLHSIKNKQNKRKAQPVLKSATKQITERFNYCPN